MAKWISRIQSLDEKKRKLVLVGSVGAVFLLICIVWIVAIGLGFSDWQGRWISGTRTYSASGTIESSNDTSPLRDKWDQTKNALGNAWGQLQEVLGSVSTTTSQASTTNTTSTASSSTESIKSNATSSTTTSN